MNNAKLGLIIVTMMAAVALFGSFIILAHQNSETKSGNNLVGNVVAAGSSSADIKEQRASSDSLIDSSLNCKWTSWKNRDTPAGTGDWETLADFSNICKNPVAIECKTTDDSTASQTGQIVTCSTDSGLVCKNADNKKGCKDYKVRFCCPITESNTSINKTKPKYDCSDSDNGINFSVKGTTSLSNGETKTDFCIVEQGKSITSKTNILREHYCSGSVIAVKQTVCQYGCNNGTCLASPIPKCIDSDGGKDYTSSGYTTGSNYKTKQYRKAKDRCSSPTELIEMYCDSNMYMKSIVYTCPYGCNTAKGVCFESPGITDDNETNTTQPPITQPASVEYSYEGYCGDGIVSVEENCDNDQIHQPDGAYITLIKNAKVETVVIGGEEYTIELLGANEDLVSAVLSINGKMFTLEKERQRHESGLYIYIQNLTSDSTEESVTLGIKTELINSCNDLDLNADPDIDGALSCTSDCKYNTTACNG